MKAEKAAIEKAEKAEKAAIEKAEKAEKAAIEKAEKAAEKAKAAEEKAKAAEEKAKAAEEKATAEKAASEPSSQKPRGRAPHGKVWNAEAGIWEANPDAPSSSSSGGASSGDAKPPVLPCLKSQYVGVTGAKYNKPGWVAKISSTSADGKKVRREFGPFATELEAAQKYDKECVELGRPVNFPAEGSDQKQAVKGSASAFLGVCWHKPAKRWTAGITVQGRNKHLGYFPNEETAALAYDEHAGPLGRPCNFPESAPPPNAELIELNKSKQKSTGKRVYKKRKTTAAPADAAAAAAAPEVPSAEALATESKEAVVAEPEPEREVACL